MESNEAVQFGKIAELARLELTELELQTYGRQLQQVIQHVGSLMAVSVDGVRPLYQPLEEVSGGRADVVQAFERTDDGVSKVLECAPEVLHQGFKVPSIL
jgi:aspartyl/glutamyl-tRNA(Asn/Gln) amidotransferase C subunit